jgi:hypothetical protein
MMTEQASLMLGKTNKSLIFIKSITTWRGTLISMLCRLFLHDPSSEAADVYQIVEKFYFLARANVGSEGIRWDRLLRQTFIQASTRDLQDRIGRAKCRKRTRTTLEDDQSE